MRYGTIPPPRATLQPVGQDLITLALAGRFVPLVGYEAEVARTLAILARVGDQRRNPVLIGEAGEARFAVVAEVVRRMAMGEAPEELAGRRVLALDVERLAAGARDHGESERRLREVLWQVNRRGCVLFVEDFPALLGGDPRYPIDGAAVLKPALHRRQVRILGTATLDAYQRFIECDAAIHSCVVPVMLGELTRGITLR
ncbi:MAG TPA: hypothetical protein VFY89_09930 [Ktedonobacterales bacterium]